MQPSSDNQASLRMAVDSLKRGDIIGYPTETVYGLGVDAENENAVTAIFLLKNRQPSEPCLLLAPDSVTITRYVAVIPAVAEKLMDAFWPGPLTLVFQAKSRLPAMLTGPDKKAAFRISSDPVCRQLMSVYRRPLVSTSANPSGQVPADSAQQVASYFIKKLPVILDGGVRKGKPSTVLDISGNSPQLIREGPVTKHMLEKITGERIGP